jgi:hypothetical protein
MAYDMDLLRNILDAQDCAARIADLTAERDALEDKLVDCQLERDEQYLQLERYKAYKTAADGWIWRTYDTDKSHEDWTDWDYWEPYENAHAAIDAGEEGHENA